MRDLLDARLYGILDSGYVSKHAWIGKCRDLIQGGADIIQLRAKKESHQERRVLLASVLPLFKECTIPLIINDDLELALSEPNLGLHIGQDDLPPAAAREALGPHRLLGLSTHSVDQAAAAIRQGTLINYFAVGPVYATQTKPTYTPVGLELVQKVAQMTSGQPEVRPWFAIGGINRQTIQAVREAGARRVVVVSDALCAQDTAKVVACLRQAMG